MKKARHQSVVAGFISAGFGGAVFASSVRLAADEGDGADIATGCTGVLLTGGASGGTGGGTSGLDRDGGEHASMSQLSTATKHQLETS